MSLKTISSLSLLLTLLGGGYIHAEGPEATRSPDRLPLVEFRQVPLEDALRVFSRQTGFQVVASPNARLTEVSIYLENVGAVEALQAMAETHGLWLSGTPGQGIVRLYTAEEFQRDAGAFRKAQTQAFTLKYPHARDLALVLRELYGDRVQLARRLSEREDPDEFQRENLDRRLERFDLFDRRSQGFGTDGRTGARAGRVRESSRLRDQNRLRGTDPRDSRLARSRELEDDDIFLDLRAEEIALLESGDQMAQEDLLNRLLERRADIFVTVIDRLNKVLVRTRDETTMQEIAALIEELDVQSAMVLMEIQILSVDLGKGLETAFDWSFQRQQGNLDGRFDPSGGINPGQLVFNYLDQRFRGTIQALEQQNRLTALGRPLLLTANNEVSRLFIGEEVPLNRDFSSGETVITPSGPVVVPGATQIEFRPVGSTLLVTPNVNDDNTVTLRLLQEESRVVRNAASVLVPDGQGGFVNRDLDTVASQTASGTFLARDSQTIAIGGLIREETRDLRRQVPLLGDIPLLGVLFRRTEKVEERREIVLLMTPYIIRDVEVADLLEQTFGGDRSYHPLAPGGGSGLLIESPDAIILPSENPLQWLLE